MHRFHVIGLPHAPTTREHCSCAYTSKVYKFCQMMDSRGHEVFHYGTEGSDPPCQENFVTLSKEDHQEFFGGHDYTQTYYPVVWDSALPYWQIAKERAVHKLKKNIRKGDFLCIIGGTAQKPIVDAMPSGIVLPVEYGIGYHGTFAPYRVFESYAHMAQIYGRDARDPDGKFFDAVIPNYFDTGDFYYHPKPYQKTGEEYYLFMGRMIRRKGLEIAVEATRHTGKKLLLCGQGATVDGDTIRADGLTIKAPHVEHVGYADIITRSYRMGNALAILAPTIYLEPFGGVVVEAALTGTPAITTDWGAFPETVEHGVTGYRCRTLEQFAWACDAAPKLDRQAIRDRAVSLYSLERVGAMYEEYFGMLSTLFADGWYQKYARDELGWLSPMKGTGL